MNFRLKTFILSFIVLIFFALPNSLFAQSVSQNETFETLVTNIREEKEYEVGGQKQISQKVEVVVSNGDREGEVISIESGYIPAVNVRKFKSGDKVIVNVSRDLEGNEIFFISDYVRRSPIYLLFFVFATLAVLIGRKRGLASLLGMGFSFFVIFKFILPQVSKGGDPVLITIFASLIIIPVTFYLSHGINKKTSTAVLGTVISLILTGILASIFVEASRLSGFASEEASFLQAAKEGLINIKGLLLAGIIIGVVGILDDITISQAAIVYKLKQTAPHLNFRELFYKAMDVGRDHIASVVNTLVLVYTGAALPLLLLFVDNPQPFEQVINYEIVAEEIVRTLVASIGLIMAVPITTFLAAYSLRKK